MTSILIVLVLSAMTGFLVYFSILAPGMEKPFRSQDRNAIRIILVLLAAFVVRLICAKLYPGHKTDMNCFDAWSNMVFHDGFSAFYASDTFTDYPPGYMYILYVIGAIRSIFPMSTDAAYILLKIPAILCDLGTGYLIYRFAKKHTSDVMSVLLAAFYVFNPAVILNSSLWGQVDAVYTLVLAGMVYLITQKKMIPSYFLFALCIFIKPQAFIFTPLVIFGIVETVFLPKFNKELFWKNLAFGIGAIAAMFIVALPFGIGHVWEQYTATLSSYPHLSVNAFNLWAAFGQNWAELTTVTSVVSTIFLVGIVAYTTYVFFKTKNPSKYYFLAAFLALATFMLSTRMHDRYAFPVMVMLLLAFIALPKPQTFILYLLASLSQFFNTAWVLFCYEKDPNAYFRTPPVNIASFLNIALLIFMIYIAQKMYARNQFGTIILDKNKKAAPTPSVSRTVHFQKSTVFAKLTKIDLIAMAVIMVVYSGIALHDLGDRHAPETEVNLASNAVTLDLGSEQTVSKIKYFLGSYELNDERDLTFTFRNNNNQVVKTDKLTSGSVFYWNEENSNNTRARYITLTTAASDLTVKEMAVLDESGNKIVPMNLSASAAALFDEQQEVPDRVSFRNSTYFDEIYHARTAYEFIHSLDPYEWTHPPLGKVFMAVGILIFGMNPFGWRIVGTVFGILMIPVIYLFAKRLLKHSWLAIITCLLFTFDFMHFAQTRIATIDVYGTFFIMLMYYFMYKYCKLSFYDAGLKKTLVPLGLSGLCMGLGVACKWTAIYAGMGLAVIFFVTIYRRYKEFLYAEKNPSQMTDGIAHQDVIRNFKPYLIKTLLFCCVMFVAVPAVIYCASYIPYLKAEGMQGLKSILDNQSAMFTYHSKTVVSSTHPYSSHWYEWPIMVRPIWYYSGIVSGTLKEGISSFGNPLVWWVGIPAFAYMLYLTFAKKDKCALFLAFSYFAQLVSWIPITRTTFIYHYFPCVPFIALMIGYSIYTLYHRHGESKYIKYGAFVYTALAIGMFALFYPVLSGQPTTMEFANQWLKWFDSWVLL